MAKTRILVVDDDEVFARCLRRILTHRLEEMTFVRTVHGATEELTKDATWSAFILDERLPDGSGLGLLSGLPAVFRGVPALILTGFSDPHVANAAFELDAKYLVKPVTAEQLERFLRLADENADYRRSRALVTAQGLPADLCNLVADVLSAAAIEGVAHAQYVYRLALLARAASGRTLSGHSALHTCAKVLGVSRSTLQDYVTVTTRWTPTEIRRLIGRRDCQGRSLTLSHLLLSARAPALLRKELERLIRDGSDLSQLHAVWHRKRMEGDGPSGG